MSLDRDNNAVGHGISVGPPSPSMRVTGKVPTAHPHMRRQMTSATACAQVVRDFVAPAVTVSNRIRS